MSILYVVATPIGNLEDLSPRAKRVLTEVQTIACEDTRRTGMLLSLAGIERRAAFVSYREGNEDRVGEELLGRLAAGETVALCTDGGYPGVSDPGFRLVREAVRRGIVVQVVPGACAATVALVVSGLSTSSYTFKGFPPRKPGVLRRFFEEERAAAHTLVLYESPYRVGKTLAAALEVLGDREAAICIELTKKFERVTRGYLSALAAQFKGQAIRGEVTLVIAGANPKFQRDPDAAAAPGDGLDADAVEEPDPVQDEPMTDGASAQDRPNTGA
jgi:16S rRNA (cytidine1402-2'-O)-methyltransferase